MRIIFCGFICLLVGACSILDVLNTTAERANIEVSRDLRYGDGERRMLDVYRPQGADGAAICVFYYGGGWESGTKDSYTFVAAALAAQGIVTVVPDYRIYPEVRFPDFLTDAARAVRWAKDHASEFGANPDRIVLAGHSAGAHIAAMLALDAQWLSTVGLDPRRDLAGLVGIAGPYDFLPLKSETLKIIFGPPEQLSRTQPIHFVKGGEPPMLLITGGFDHSVDPRNSARLAAKLESTGGTVTTINYPWIGHALVLGAVARPLRVFAPTLRDTSAFINKLSPASLRNTFPRNT
ncbi:MAG: alpha/beta hydrolase fold protein [Rhodospirillales bacterium]|jgi:acetyl esterase/lipase|nr:alpha/beta hydrolase fold protein [Rhodospirillales bacterium]